MRKTLPGRLLSVTRYAMLFPRSRLCVLSRRRGKAAEVASGTVPYFEASMQREWSYQEAFSRNLGLIDPQGPETLRCSRLAIPGMGGVGGIHLLTLARLGVGAFRIAEPDAFDVVNFNRQLGAEVQTLGRSKAEVMRERACNQPRTGNRPARRADLGAERGRLSPRRGYPRRQRDFFAFDARRLLFRKAREQGIWAMTAGPIGFSTAWLVFDPKGMSFDEYFDMHDGMEPVDQFAAFLVGLTPRATHFGYIDLSYVDAPSGRGPSVGLACYLGRRGDGCGSDEDPSESRGRCARCLWFAQFDAYRCLLHGAAAAGAIAIPGSG